MAYRVELANSAETQLEELYLWVIERAPSRGAAWFNGLERIAPESFDPDQPVRVLNYGRSPHVYRVFFTVDDGTRVVRVVHIRRGARRGPAPSELKRD